jgi:predicted small lipoprotein YifL
MSSRPRAFAALLAAVSLTLSLTACGSDSKKPGTLADHEITATPSAQVTGTPASDAKVIAVTVTTDSVTPDGGTIQIKKGQPIVFKIQAAAEGELHVHSSPATAINYPAGASQASITIDQPGLIEVEIENLGKPVAQLEVR